MIIDCGFATFPLQQRTQPRTIMPYLLISTQIRLENGPTICGDEWSDKKLMEYLGATLQKLSGNNFSEYRVAHPPRVVLNKLEELGYRVVSLGGVGQTCIWTLYCESPKEPWKTGQV